MTNSNSSRSYQVLRHRDYRLLWSAEILSVSGSEIQRVAVAWQVFEMTGDAFKLGLIGLCRFVPMLLFGIAGGVIADRGDRRRTLMVTQGILLLTSLAFAVLTITNTIHLLTIYALVVVGATVEGISNPTRQALLPLLVPRSELPSASTMGFLGFQTARVGGPAAGGFIIAGLGLSAAYVIDAASFLAVIAAVLLMHAKPERIKVTGGGLEAAREGLKFLRNTPVLLGMMMADFMAVVLGTSLVLMPIFAEDILGVGAGGLGLLLAAPAAGSTIMAIILSITRLPDRAGIGVLVGIVIYGACLAGFGLSTSFLLSLALLAGSGAADAVSATLRHATRNLLSPDEMRGRTAGVHRTLAAGGSQLGDFKAGILASAMGTAPSVVLTGVLTMAVAGAVGYLIPAIPKYRFLSPEASDPRSDSEARIPAKQ